MEWAFLWMLSLITGLVSGGGDGTHGRLGSDGWLLEGSV